MTPELFDALRSSFLDSDALHLEPLELAIDAFDDGLEKPSFFMAESTAKNPSPRATVLLDEQLNLDADALIRDPLLGSLGLVHVLPERESDMDHLRDLVDKALDSAIFLRHLLVEEARRQKDGRTERFPYCVEIVFLVPPGADPSVMQTLSNSLHLLAQESTVINAIGVNVWTATDLTSLRSRSTLRRAFPWLLREVALWLESPDNRVTGFHERRPVQLRTYNFRRRGERRLELHPTRELHVVHGSNGSGKTSISEAMELLLTGRVDRIPDSELSRTLTFQTAPDLPTESAIVEVRLAGARSANAGPDLQGGWTVRADFPKGKRPFALIDAPGSFRLHQALADAFMPEGPQRAAEEILRAFFPNENDALVRLNEARTRVEKALGGLPDALRKRLLGSRDTVDANFVHDSLAWLRGPSCHPSKLHEWLTLTVSQVEVLRPLLDPGFVESYLRDVPLEAGTLNAYAASLDAGYSDLTGEINSLLILARRSAELLTTLSSFVVQDSGPASQPASQRMNEWLVAIARTDLAEREHAILLTLEESASTDWGYVSGLPVLARELRANGVIPAKQREKLLETLRRTRDTARRDLPSHSLGTSGAAAARPLEDLIRATVEATLLDQAATRGLFGLEWSRTEVASPFTEPLAEVLRRGVPVEAGPENERLMFGTPGWTDSLISRLLPLQQVLEQLRADLANQGDVPPRPSAILAALESILEAANQAKEVQKSLENKLDQILAPDSLLFRAVNELLALFTPARWAYVDLESETRLVAEQQSIDMRVNNSPARWILNTAEQNAFALALFLLCAQRRPNPLRLLVLDDPLQNMDEFTVVAVARGISRLMRLMSRKREVDPPWQLLLLLHNRQNVDRLRAEAPCSVLSLPWLAPSPAQHRANRGKPDPAADGEVNYEPHLPREGLQGLTPLIDDSLLTRRKEDAAKKDADRPSRRM